jgi:hypothetical protein
MFRGQLFKGHLFDGQLYGLPLDEEVPQVEIQFYTGGGLKAEQRAREEAELVKQVLDKWRVIEEARVRKEARLSDRKAQIERVQAIIEAPAEQPEPIEIAPDLGPIVPKTGTLPVIQTLFTPGQQPERRAPTRSTPVTVIPIEDDMEDVMTVLLALEEAGEI